MTTINDSGGGKKKSRNKRPTAKQAVGGYAAIQAAKKKGPSAKEAVGGYGKIMKGAKSKTKKAVSRLNKKGV